MSDSKIEILKGHMRYQAVKISTIVDLIKSAVAHEQWGALDYNLGRLKLENDNMRVLLDVMREEVKHGSE